MTVVYFGSDLFAKQILAFLIEKKIPISAVVTAVDRPKGRLQKMTFTPVKELIVTSERAIPLYQPERVSAPDFVSELSRFKPSLLVVVSYGQFLKQNLLNLPSIGTINVHPSLLPKYRGPSPIQSAVLAGEKETGVTIMEVVLEMDAGDIIDVEKISIGQEETFGEVEEKLIQISKKLLAKTVEKILEEKKIIKTPQDSSWATFTKKIFPEDAQIKFDLPAWRVHNHIRGMNPRPGARCMVEIGGKNQSLKIMRSRVLDIEQEGKFLKGHPPGTILFFNKKEGFVVACKEGFLQVISLQLEGGREMSFLDFINGFHEPIFLL